MRAAAAQIAVPAPFHRVLRPILLTGLLAAFCGTALADDDGAPAVDDQRAAALAAAAELQKKMAEIDEQYRTLMEKVSAVEQQRRDLERLLTEVNDLDSYRGGQDTGGAPAVVGAEQKAEKEAAEARRPEIPRVSPDVGGVLTPRGRLVLEPSFQYIYSSYNRLSIEGFTILPALLIGVIDIVEADRDTYIGNLTTRYGLTNRLELELRAPWVVREDSTRTREFLTDSIEEEVFTSDANDLGDIEFGIRYQFPRNNPEMPFFTGNLRVKSDTGTDPFELASKASLSGEPDNPSELATGSGFWSFNPSVTFLYPSDPVVFFGNVGYLWTLEDDKGGRGSTGEPGQPIPFGDVDPGDAVRFNVGMGFSLNERSSFSLSYSLDIYDETTIELAAVPKIAGSDVTVGKFLIGYSLNLGKGQPFNLAIGIGATDDAPDTDITFRLPFNFFR